MNDESDVATLFFTQLKLEGEIQKIKEKIIAARNNKSLPDPIRDLELNRLFEVHNKLEIEFQRIQEDYLKKFVKSLNLEEMNIKPISEGTLKCHLVQQRVQRFPKNRSKSSGFIDTFSDQSNSFSDINFSSDILGQRKSEINTELRRLSFKESLSPQEIKRRNELLTMLHNISG